jgi:hypothetical protein
VIGSLCCQHERKDFFLILLLPLFSIVQVAEKRKRDIAIFLSSLFQLAEEIAHSGTKIFQLAEEIAHSGTKTLPLKTALIASIPYRSI